MDRPRTLRQTDRNMVSGNFGAESRTESSDHRRACGQTKSAAKLTSAARSVAQPGQRHTLVSATPWRRCGSQIAHEGFQTTSAPGQEGYAGPSARAAITATVLLELPAASYRLVPNILHHSESQRTYNSRICIAWPSLNTAGDSRSTSHYCTAHASDAQHSDSLIALINLTD